MNTISQSNTRKQLKKYAKAMRSYHLRDAFDKGTLSKYAFQFNGLSFDYNKLYFSDTALGLLLASSPKAGI